MKLLNIIKILFRNFRKKMRISVRNPHTGAELWYIFISPMNAVVAFLSLVLITFIAVIMTIIYTPILDMIPGYPGNRSRELLIRNLIRLDSIERQIQTWDTYRNNLTLIMDGKPPMSVTASKNADSISGGQKNIVPPSEADANFRKQTQAAIETGNAESRRNGNNVRAFELFAPVHGVVTRRFAPGNDDNGITLSVAGRQPVATVTDGAVLLNTWTPEDGYIMQVQHGGNMISMYRHLAGTTKKAGERVKAGEIIGYVGGDDETSGGPAETAKKGEAASLHFELWDNGTAVDPEDFILF